MHPLSVCMIGRNEEKNIEKCLTPLVEFVAKLPKGSEIVFVDTGSTDRTKELVARYADRQSYRQMRKPHAKGKVPDKGAYAPIHMYEFVWCDDFSAARNFSLEKAKNDLVLVLDCDEFLVEYDLDFMGKMIDCYPGLVGVIKRESRFINANGSEGIYTDWVERFFSKSLYHYKWRIHEQVAAIAEDKPYAEFELPFRVEHGGYVGDGEGLTAKSKRNEELLLKMIEDEPDNPYHYFQLGQCYNVLHDDANALAWYERALALPLDTTIEYVEMLINAAGHCMLHLDRVADAKALMLQYYEAFASSDLFCFAGEVYMREGDVVKALLEFMKAILCEKQRRQGTNSFIPYYNIGTIYEALGKKELAIENYRKCGDFAPALEKLEMLKEALTAP